MVGNGIFGGNTCSGGIYVSAPNETAINKKRMLSIELSIRF